MPLSLPSAGSATEPRPDGRSEVTGSTLPRLWTPPLVVGPPGPCGCGCALTPETSVGFDQVEFADETLGRPFLPWQRWLVIHGGELLPDGRPRFRIVHVQVARQNGKTEIPVILSLYWQTVEQVPMVLGTSTKLDYARESWMKAVRLAEKAPGLKGLIPAKRREWTRQTNGEQESWIGEAESRYKIGAANEEGGRSLTIHRLIMDELRQHHDYSAWDAAVPAGNAVRDFQAWTLSNAGTSRSVVLNDERAAALLFIKTGKGSVRTGWFEWSCDEGAAPDDIDQLAKANPALGITIDPDALLSDAGKAMAVGGEKLAGYKRECMCLSEEDPDDVPVTVEAWTVCLDEALTLVDLRSRVHLCLDVSPDGKHVSLVAAAMDDGGLVLVDVVRAWSGDRATEEARVELGDLVGVVKPRKRWFFPAGPAAQLRPDLEALKFEALVAGDSAAACMGLAELVRAGRLRHGGDPLLTDHVVATKKWPTGDGWRFVRRGVGHCDAAYAAAGAVLKARKPVVERNVRWL